MIRFIISFSLAFIWAASTLFSQPQIKVKPGPYSGLVQSILNEKLQLGEKEAKPSPLSPYQKTFPPQNNSCIEEILSESEEPEAEIYAAMNPNDTNNIIVSSMMLDVSNNKNDFRLNVYRTVNYGATWEKINFNYNPQNAQLGGGGDPVIAFDKNGKAYITWLTVDIALFGLIINLTLHSAYSEDKGASWTYMGIMDTEALLFGAIGGLVDKEWMAIDNSNSSFQNNIYCTYTKASLTVPPAVMLKSKSAGETTFSNNTVKVSSRTFEIIQFSSVVVDNKGVVHVGFVAGTPTDVDFFHTFSTDGGKTFMPETRVTSIHMPGAGAATGIEDSVPGLPRNRTYPWPYLHANPITGDVYAVFAAWGLDKKEGTGTDVFVATLDQATNKWGMPHVVNPTASKAQFQFHPTAAVSPKGDLVVWYHDRGDFNDPNTTLTSHKMVFSKDGGKSFNSPIALSCQPSDFNIIKDRNNGLGAGEYSGLVCTPHTAIAFWADGRKNNGDIDIYYAKVPLSGNLVEATEVNSLEKPFEVSAPSPNPSQGVIQFDIILHESSDVLITYTSENGSIISAPMGSGQKMAPGTHHITHVLPPGTWFCRVDTDFGYKTMKVIIQK